MRHQKIKNDRTIAHHCWPRTKEHGQFKLIFCFISFLIIFIVAFLSWQNNYLLIKQVTVERNDYDQKIEPLISGEEIKNLIQQIMVKNFLFFFRQNTLLTLRDKTIKDKLLNESRIQSINIQKKWPDQLIINFSENKPTFRLSILGDKDYYLSSTGQIITLFSNILRPLKLPLVLDSTDLAWQNPKLSKAIQIALNLLKQNELSGLFKPVEAKISQDQGIIEIKIITEEGWSVHFLPGENIKQQLANLKVILENQITPAAREGLEYIDLRFGDRVYYK